MSITNRVEELFYNCFISELKKRILSGEDCLSVQKAQKGDEVTVHYEGRLKSNGFKFDSSLDRDDPITFELGTNLVVAGWERGLVGTCPNQTISLDVPSVLGYGSSGAGSVIPPDADLLFNITLLSLKSNKVKIDVIDPKDCSNDKKTRDNDIVKFDYIGYLEDGSPFDSTLEEGRGPIEGTIGEIKSQGWNEALKGACPGETRMVLIPYQLAFGNNGADGVIPPNTNLVLQMTIISVRNRVLNFLDRISTGGFRG